MATSNNLLEELKLRMNGAAQANQAAINDKMLEILEAFQTRLDVLEQTQNKFSAFDGDGDGRPGGSKPKKPKDIS